MHRPTLHLIASLLTALLLLACDSDQSHAPQSPTTTATPTATATPSSTPRRTPTPIITTVTPAPTPFPDPPPLRRQPATSELEALLNSSDPLVVVSGELQRSSAPGRAWPTIAVVTLDSAGDEQARLAFGAVDRYAQSWHLVDEEIVVGFEYAIVRYRLDGTIATVLRPEGELGYQSLLLSPDGSKIAFAEFGDPDCGIACVVFADATTGIELGRVPHDGTALQDLQRFANPTRWRGNDAVLVRGSPNGHAATGLATVYLDGHIEMHPTNPNGTFSPSGEQILRWAGTVEGYENDPMTCGFLRGFDIYDIGSGTVVASSRSATAGMSNARWSPDGTEILIERKLLPNPEEVQCDGAYRIWFQNLRQWSLLDLRNGVEREIDDPLTTWQRWYGSPFADITCPDGRIQLLGSSDRTQLTECIDSNHQSLAQATIRLDGTSIATGPWDRILGVLKPTPN